MINKYFTLAFTFFALATYGQQIDFQPNVNYKAQFLEQNIDEKQNYLVLESKAEDIRQVDIFNEDYSESINVNSNKTNIDLNTLPTGNYIIQARVNKKRIVMYLEKTQTMEVVTSEERYEEKTVNNIRLNQKKEKARTEKASSYYWVVIERNSGMGSGKTMKLVHQNELKNLIKKNKLELQTKNGKDNKLLVYELYNKNKFMNKQFRNPEYFKSTETSKHFNTTPIYASKHIDSNQPTHFVTSL